MLKTTLFSLLLFSFVSLSQQVKAQTDSKKASEKPQNFSSENNLYFGLGLGLDYGGLGTRIEIMPLPFIGFFGAVGYNLQSLAFNGGFSLKILEDEPFTPTIQGMYGYNAVSLPGYSYSGKTYYGPSVGIGVDGKFGKYAHKLSQLLIILSAAVNSKVIFKTTTIYYLLLLALALTFIFRQNKAIKQLKNYFRPFP